MVGFFSLSFWESSSFIIHAARVSGTESCSLDDPSGDKRVLKSLDSARKGFSSWVLNE